MPTFIYFVLVLLFFWVADCAKKNVPHSHQGVLEPYDGRPLPEHLSADQRRRLEKGEAVIYNERDGKSGYGVVVQDINATSTVCMDKISDLKNYHRMVPHVKSVEIYEQHVLPNGSSRIGAQFTVGLMGMSFGYFLKLKHEPKYNTFTWTQDYRHCSDFDDNVGHWQVSPHPSRGGWTRLLYSCKVKLLPWIPEFVVSFLTTKALTEATGWVKREAELEQSKRSAAAVAAGGTAVIPSGGRKGLLPRWFGVKGGSREGDLTATVVDGRRSLDVGNGPRKPGPLWRLTGLRLPGKLGRL